MRHLHFAWPRMAMPGSFMLMLLFLLGMSGGCQGQGNEKTFSVPTPAVSPATSQQGPYQPRTHQYGPYLLKQSSGRFDCEIYNDSARYYIKEDFPGILIHERKPVSGSYVRENITTLEYYDTIKHQLKKRIDLEKRTPYNKHTYQGISIGGLDYEYMEIVEMDSNCVAPKFPRPSYYYTHNWIPSISADGYVCVSSELLKMAKPRIVVGWEQTLVIFDPQGNEVRRFQLKHTTANPIVAEEGKYLIFSYGGAANSVNNPFEPCKRAMEIYDLKNGKMILQYEAEKNAAPGESKEEAGLIYSRFFARVTSQSEQLIIDLDKKEVKVYKFIWTKDLLPPWPEYKAFLNSLPFQTIKF